MIDDDSQLLHQYHDDRSQEAFTQLVRRHLNLVYFAALRRVGGDAHLADDVAQRVFTDLARKASSLKDRPTLTGWLYTSTRFAAAQAVRSERRRKTHEQEAQTMHELHYAPEPNWDHLRPVIDEAMDDLNERDREAVLLRFFENLPLAEVGAKFSLSPDAARMRVDRALEKLRGLLAKRGIVSTAAALAAVFATQSSMAAPAGLPGKIVSSALARSTAASAATTALWKTIAASTTLIGGIGIFFYVIGESRPPAEPAGQEMKTAARADGEVSSPGAPVAAQSPEPISGRDSPGVGRFDQLAATEMKILKRLWKMHVSLPAPLPGTRRGIVENPQFANDDGFYAAAENLQSYGLVGIGAKKGVVFLTPNGVAFCEAHAAEINAHEPTERNNH